MHLLLFLALAFVPAVKHVPPVPPQVHFVVSLSKVRSIFITPAGAKVPPPLVDAGLVAGAIVTYPDGTTQIADANGIFDPPAAKYASSNDEILELNPDAQPAVKLQDPAGSALASAATIAGYADASLGAPLEGLRTLPAGTELFSGSSVLLSAEGTDTSDHAASLAGLTVTWSALTGKIVPIPGTATAVYTSPNVSEPLLDMVRATVTSPGASVSVTSTSAIETLPASNGYTFHGTITSVKGAPIPGAAALFTAQGTSRVFGSYNFFARANAKGTYSALLPANLDLLASVGTNAADSPNGMADFFLTDNEVETGDPGGSALVNLSVHDNSGEFDDGKEDASHAIAPPIASVRDAWFGTEFTTPGPWAADSGFLAVLAAPPKTFPSPSVPTALHAGLFADWCYQWILSAGVPTFVLVENGAATCTAPGTVAYALTAAPSGYAFVRYATAAGKFVLRAPLDPTLGGTARLMGAGSWTLGNVGILGNPFVALVRVDDYGPAAPRFGSPHSTERFRYTYAANGLASVTIDQDVLMDVASGRTVQTATVKLTQLAALNASGCFRTAQPSPCYALTANVERYAYTSAGTVASPYLATGTYDGDGSESRIFAANRRHARSSVTLPVASRARRASGNCSICAPADGALLDGDGVTQLATTTSADDGIGTLTLLDTEQDGPPGGPVVVMTFAL